MEKIGEKPDWNECDASNRRENEATIDALMSAKISPEEFKPEKDSSWQGISFEEWIKYVMDGKTPRP
jgi:hypothetical protein